MRAIIDQNIQWDKLGTNRREQLRYEIQKASISKESKTLHIYLISNFVVPYADLQIIRQKISQSFPDLQDIVMHFSYQDVIIPQEELLHFVLPHLIHGASDSHKALMKTIFLDRFQIQEERLTLFALGDETVKALNRIVAREMESVLLREFSLTFQVVFENSSFEYNEKNEEKEKLMMREINNLVDQNRPSASAIKKKMQPITSNRILGKPIQEETTPLSALAVTSGSVVIEGSLFRKEIRQIKNNKLLITLLMTDLASSIGVKLFSSEEKWSIIDEHLETGENYRIRGNVEFDIYENVPVIMAKDIERLEKRRRQDLHEIKRVELHAHTKMSAMDGLNETSNLVLQAAEWGHKAIAITDHGVVQAFPEAMKTVKSKKLDIKIIYGMEGYLYDDSDDTHGSIDYKSKPTSHIILLVKNQEGLKNLYKLVSLSHLEYFYKKPRIPKSILAQHRNGLILGSACEAGEVFRGVVSKIEDKLLEQIVSFYDYLEIQPLVNNQFLIENGTVTDEKELQLFNQHIIDLGEKYHKPVVATCDAHYTHPEEAVYRKILFAGQGYKDVEGDEGLYFRTTEEMLSEFSYLGAETAHRIVIDAPNRIADLVEIISPVPSHRYAPKIEGADEILRSSSMEKALRIYGDPLPEVVKNRLERELNSIIKNGYAVMYVSAQMLVKKSLEDGYLVGSRGSVGSSFAATMAGITEVNPLAPHYICPNPQCKHSEFVLDGSYDCGADMPAKTCPNCHTPYIRDGFEIPFEVFLGFEGDKEPDIDLNFAGEYQPVAHKFVEEIFGKENVFRAGTIGTIAKKTAYGFVMKYFEERQQPINKWEVERLAEQCTGVRRTTGQHPGGIIILPRGMEIYDFCPVQHPANDTNSEIITTHFDYHSIDENLLKLDILGHDVPSMIRMLQDMTGVDPLTVSLQDEKVHGLFLGTDGLAIQTKDYRFRHGSYGIPEFGTKFVRQMLDDTRPSSFADLVRISGFSHGENVWINNAQEFIRNGTATIKEAISTRDDIMNYLIHKGVPNKIAFRIMESVRKGKGVTDEEATVMSANKVPDWYIESCRRIRYMFPKAHAVAYVMMSYRIAFYKVYHPVAFYAVHFTTKIADFDADTILKGMQAVLARIDNIEAKGKNATKKEEDELSVLEVAYEMYARGYSFSSAQIGRSDATRFLPWEGKVLLPYLALSGVGENAAKGLAEESLKRPFLSVDDIRSRAKLNQTAVEALQAHGVFQGLPESDQLSLF